MAYIATARGFEADRALRRQYSSPTTLRFHSFDSAQFLIRDAIPTPPHEHQRGLIRSPLLTAFKASDTESLSRRRSGAPFPAAHASSKILPRRSAAGNTPRTSPRSELQTAQSFLSAVVPPVFLSRSPLLLLLLLLLLLRLLLLLVALLRVLPSRARRTPPVSGASPPGGGCAGVGAPLGSTTGLRLWRRPLNGRMTCEPMSVAMEMGMTVAGGGRGRAKKNQVWFACRQAGGGAKQNGVTLMRALVLSRRSRRRKFDFPITSALALPVLSNGTTRRRPKTHIVGSRGAPEV